jgi:hypothetical protein
LTLPAFFAKLPGASLTRKKSVPERSGVSVAVDVSNETAALQGSSVPRGADFAPFAAFPRFNPPIVFGAPFEAVPLSAFAEFNE